MTQLRVHLRHRPRQPFTLTVSAHPNPDTPDSLVYESVLNAAKTKVVTPHNSLAELRSFIHGIKLASMFLGHDIREPRIPTMQDLPPKDCSNRPLSS